MSHDVAESVLTPLRFLERSAQVWAERPAVVSGERTFTYAEHHERIRRLAGALQELGVEPGDRVATLLPNVHAMLELHYAVPGIGAVLVPLNTRLTRRRLRLHPRALGRAAGVRRPRAGGAARRPARRSPTTSR